MTARDPHCVFASWEMTAAEVGELAGLPAGGHVALRIRSESTPHLQREIRLGPEERHAFVNVANANETYLAELGWVSPTGEWRTIASSNPARTPSETISTDRTVMFATIPPDLQPIPPAAPARSPEAPVQEAAPAPHEVPGFQAPAMPPLPHPPRLDFRWVPEAGALRPPPEGKTTAKKPTNGEWSWAQEQALERIIRTSSFRQQQIGSLELVELLPGEAERQISSITGRPVAELPKLPSEMGITSPAGGQPQAISSAEFVSRPGRRGFWFNVNAELIIYGATEPNATVTIGGRQIRLRPDGTFSYRFALPDGTYALPLAATSFDGERRSAQLGFHRETAYQGEVGAHPQDPALKTPRPENAG